MEIPELYSEYYGIYKKSSCPNDIESYYAGILFTSANHLKFNGIRKANIILWNYHGNNEHNIKKMFMNRYNIPTDINWIKQHMAPLSKTQVNSARYRINNLYKLMPSNINELKIIQTIIFPKYKYTHELYKKKLNINFNLFIEFICVEPLHKFKELYIENM